MLRPEKLDVDMNDMSMLSKMSKIQEELMLRTPTEDEDPILTDMRRRFRDAFLEADDFGVFQPK